MTRLAFAAGFLAGAVVVVAAIAYVTRGDGAQPGGGESRIARDRLAGYPRSAGSSFSDPPTTLSEYRRIA